MQSYFLSESKHVGVKNTLHGPVQALCHECLGEKPLPATFWLYLEILIETCAVDYWHIYEKSIVLCIYLIFAHKT